MKTKHQHIIDYSRLSKSRILNLYVWYRHLFIIRELYGIHYGNAIRLLGIEKPFELNLLLNETSQKVEEYINNPTYISFTLPKKRGGTRQIDAPTENFKTILRVLNRYLQSYYLQIRPPEVHGFVPNSSPHEKKICNIADNARPHIGKRHLMNIDLHDFFPSITSSRIRELFRGEYFRYDEHIASALALLTTYKGRLPTGAPTSPVLSNFICLQLDAELRQYCQIEEIMYTRYADDLSFSSDKPFLSAQINTVKLIIEKNRFQINPQKTRLSGANRKQTVTGLVVNTRVNVDRMFIRKTRAMLHDAKKHGVGAATSSHFGIAERTNEEKMIIRFLNGLEGRINFIGQIRGWKDAIYLKLNEEFRKTFWITESA